MKSGEQEVFEASIWVSALNAAIGELVPVGPRHAVLQLSESVRRRGGKKSKRTHARVWEKA